MHVLQCTMYTKSVYACALVVMNVLLVTWTMMPVGVCRLDNECRAVVTWVEDLGTEEQLETELAEAKSRGQDMYFCTQDDTTYACVHVLQVHGLLFFCHL